MSKTKEINGWAIAGFILSLLSINAFLAIVALIISIVSLVKSKKYMLSLTLLSIIGIVLSSFWMIIWLYDGNIDNNPILAIIFIGNIALTLILLIAYFIYSEVYFSSEKFLNIKNKIQKYVEDCNEMNNYIEELKGTYVNIQKSDYGEAINVDNSNYNYQRKKLKNYYNNNYVYNCSLSVCRNAQLQPFKYLCKYFNIDSDEDTLSMFEDVLNKFSAAEQGTELLKNKKSEILNGVWDKVPFLIKSFSKIRFERELGFEPIDFNSIYFPTYYFNYISPGGNSSMSTYITLDIENLNKFVKYLSEIVKFRKSVAGQRALMTSSLREKIKKRDNYTCQNCNNSIKKEPNLLLEIDHIKPLSKGGITSEENLQVLCWRCNRSKGSKLIKAETIDEEKTIGD